jgi:benzoyl-CoA reductase subunit D
MLTTAGIDIGAGSVKVVLFRSEGDDYEWLAKRTARIRTHDPFVLTRNTYDELLSENNLAEDDIDYCATTGEGESIHYSTGHFYSMTTHARGAIYLQPDSRSVLDIGALHGRAIKIDERGKVLNYKMTSQCASGSGQYLHPIFSRVSIFPWPIDWQSF